MAQGRSREFGQLIPQDDGDNTICYRVTIPNTSEWRILFHSLVFHWTSGRYWKRTAEGRTIKDVQSRAWEIYNQLELCEDENGTVFPPETEIITITKECRMSCNCCGCDPNQESIAVENPEDVFPDEIEVSTTVPPTTIPADLAFPQWKCGCAQQILTLLRQSILGAANLREIGEANYGTILNIVTGTLGRVQGGLLYVRLWEIWLALVYIVLHLMIPSFTTALAVWIDNNRVNLQNIMFCAGSGQDAQTGFREYVQETTTLSFLQRQTMNLWVCMIPFEALFQDLVTRMTAPDFEIIIDLPEICICPTPPSEFNLPVNYVLVDMLADIVDNVNGGEFTDMGNMWQFVGGGNAGNDITLLQPQFNEAEVPNANRRGFLFELISTEILQEDAFGHNLANSSTQFSQISFGNAVGNWLAGEIFSGVIDSDATLQAWAAGETHRHQDLLDCTVEEGDIVCRFLHYGDDTGNPPLSTSILKAYWIVNTVGL